MNPTGTLRQSKPLANATYLKGIGTGVMNMRVWYLLVCLSGILSGEER